MNTAEKISRLEQMLARVRSNRGRSSARGVAPVPAQSATPALARPSRPEAAGAASPPPSSEAVTERRGALGAATTPTPAAAAPPAAAKPDRSDDVEITVEDAGSPDIEIVETDLEDVTEGEAFGMAQEQLHEVAAAPDAIVTAPRPGPPDDAGLADVTLPALDPGLPKGLEPALPTPTTTEGPTPAVTPRPARPVAPKPATAARKPAAAAAKAPTPKPTAPVAPVKKPLVAKPAAQAATARKPLARPAAASPTPKPAAAAAKTPTPQPTAPVAPVKKPLAAKPAVQSPAPAAAPAVSPADVVASPAPEPAPALVEAAAAGRIEELRPQAVQPMRVASGDVGDFIGEVRKVQPASFGDVVAATLDISFGSS